MDLKDWITPIGWLVTFTLGALSAGVIVPRLTRKRKIVAWSLLDETNVVPRELSEILGLPVVLQVGDQRPVSLSVVKIRFCAIGNEVIDNIALVATFGKDAHILRVRAVKDLGEYAKQISWVHEGGRCELKIAFFNPGRCFDLEFLLSGYEQGTADVDGSGPGLELQRRKGTILDLNVRGSVLRSISLSLLGFRYDPGVSAMSEIAEELRVIRRSLQK